MGREFFRNWGLLPKTTVAVVHRKPKRSQSMGRVMGTSANSSIIEVADFSAVGPVGVAMNDLTGPKDRCRCAPFRKATCGEVPAKTGMTAANDCVYSDAL